MNKSEVREKIETDGIKNVILNALPQDATNGDVIKILFPKITIQEFSDIIIVINEDMIQHHHYPIDLWNARYKAGNEVKE